MKIILDPASDIFYGSYYLKGLLDLNPYKIYFSSKPFKELNYNRHTHIFPFIYVDENKKKIKVAVDFADFVDINAEFYDWCDRYGKINLNRDALKISDLSKIISIPPGFAIKVWNRNRSLYYGAINYLKSFNRSAEFKSYISRYLKTLQRLPYFQEPDFISKNNYIYFTSSYWEGQDITNRYRENFINACLNIKSIHFEGGFVTNHINLEEFKTLSTKKAGHEEYIKKLSKSAVVFNTPAYHLCHGWKLAEYFSLGKAIISTKIINELPEKLVHKKNIYFVNGDVKSIEDAIITIINSPSLKNTLELEAYNYYLRNVSPLAVITRLINY